MTATTRDVSVIATDALYDFSAAGILEFPDVQVARRLAFLYGETGPEAILALALAVRALRAGSVCIDLQTIAGEGWDADVDPDVLAALEWPEAAAWLDIVARSPLVTVGELETGLRPLRLVSGLLYLEKYWGQQERVRRLLHERSAAREVDRDLLGPVLDRLFPGDGLVLGEPDLQRLAAETAVANRVAVIAGGPGTGKTTTVARILAAIAAARGSAPSVALAAPTGKAAARLQEAVRSSVAALPDDLQGGLAELPAMTVHKLLGANLSGGVRFDADHPLPQEVIVVDELSMLPLTMMAALLSAVRPDASLILVGDPDQLASVEAGAVLADIASSVERDPGGGRSHAAIPLVRLRHTWRFGGAIGRLATAVRDGDAELALSVLHESSDSGPISFIPMEAAAATAADLAGFRDDVVSSGTTMVAAARDNRVADAVLALDDHRVLCGHRTGPMGAARWGHQVERWLAEAIPGYVTGDEWYVGRPLLITRNEPDLGVFNGDAGVIVADPRGARVAFPRGRSYALLTPAQLQDVQTVHAMTIHKSQGSQFRAVTVILPPPGSPLLTRELLYTAITRASESVRLIGSPDAVREAIARPALRASGLRTRL